ncbi:MAG: peptidase [Actinobacteria bacterium 69-20]|jgi:predicted Zn-dependent protease|nr:MAG: peptidase [Actinobacteria bacterium 69-20]
MMGDRVPAGLLTPEQIVEAGLAASRTDGCVVVVHSTSQANARWANNTVTTSGMATSVDFYVVAVVDTPSGRAAATVAGSSADAASAVMVEAVVRAAEDAARAASAGGAARDAMALFGTGNSSGMESGFSDDAVPTSFDVFSGVLPSLAAAFDDARAGSRVLYGFARHEMRTVHLGTSTGLRRRWVQPTGTFELNAKSADLARSAWTGASTVDFTDIDVAAAGLELSERLRWAERRVDLPPGRYDTVLPPTSVADFLIYLAWSAAARPAHEGRSAFASAGGTRSGERLTDRALDLYGDPHAPGLECSPFVETAHSSDEVSVFDNGTPAGRIELVKGGVLHDLVHTRASAAEYGAAFTPVPDNLILTGGDETRSTADLVAGVERGLLLTSLWYIREVDPMTLLLTGLTRDGVFLIEHGEVTAAVNNFRFNVSPFDVLRHSVDVGRTERCLSREWSDFFTRSAMPAIRVDGFHMSSVSQAQ